MLNRFYLLCALAALSITAAKAEEPIRILLDCDTANEIDDPYAIARAIFEPRFDIVGLTASQWRTQPNAPDDTVTLSQRMNEEIIELTGRDDIPLAIGSNDAMSDADTPLDSPAARLIIEKAHETPDGERLIVASTGAMTNLASAILIDPSIREKTAFYSMGLRYEDGQWNTNEFNARNDLTSVECLFKTEGVEWHVMTATASRPLQYDREETLSKLRGRGGLHDYLAEHWASFVPRWKPDMKTDRWIMWDVALIEAILAPELAQEKQVSAPPDIKTERKTWVYTSIDEERMLSNYWDGLIDNKAD